MKWMTIQYSDFKSSGRVIKKKKYIYIMGSAVADDDSESEDRGRGRREGRIRQFMEASFLWPLNTKLRLA